MKERTLGENIKKYRKALELTQKELASRLNLSEKTISAYERDMNEPDISTIQSLAEALQINTSMLIADKRQKQGMHIIQIHPDSYNDLLETLYRAIDCGEVFNFRGTTIQRSEYGSLKVTHEGEEYFHSLYDGALNTLLGLHYIWINGRYREERK